MMDNKTTANKILDANKRYMHDTIKNDDNKYYGVNANEFKRYLNINRKRKNKFIKGLNTRGYLDEDADSDDTDDDDENPIPEHSTHYPLNIYDKIYNTYMDAMITGDIITHKTQFYILEQHEMNTLIYIKNARDGLVHFNIKPHMTFIFKEITNNENIDVTPIRIDRMRKQDIRYGINKGHADIFKGLRKKYKGVYFDIRSVHTDLLKPLFKIDRDTGENKSTLLLKCGLMYDFYNEQWYTHRKHIKAVQRTLKYILGYNAKYNGLYLLYTTYDIFKLHEITENPEHIYISEFIKNNYLIFNNDITYENGTAYKDKYISKKAIKEYIQSLLYTHGIYKDVNNIITRYL
jgi:hypothetical protein